MIQIIKIGSSCSFVCRLHHIIIIIMQTYLKALNNLNACQVYDAECVSKIKTILSIIFYSIYRAVSSAYPILLWWSWECVLCLIIIIKPEVWIINHCQGLGHETKVCTVCLTMFLWICDMTTLLRGTFHVLYPLLLTWFSEIKVNLQNELNSV